MLSNLFRIYVVIRVVIVYRLDALFLPKRKCLSTYLWWVFSRDSLKNMHLTDARRLFSAFIELGPIFVKFGQLLSTRSDILPDEFVLELEKLQDKVPAFSGELAKKIVQRELKRPFEDVFSSFIPTPIGSASIAQVHAAVLLNGKEVVVKILHPGIQEKIKSDISMLFMLAKLLDRFHPKRDQLRAKEIVYGFAYNLTTEQDFLVEAANISKMSSNFENDKSLYLPSVYWEYTTRSILVMEHLKGKSIKSIQSLKKSKVNMKKLAQNGVDIFLKQVFKYNFFHADMHPGNIFVDISDKQEPIYQLVDFGIVGSLPKKDQRFIAENLVAFFSKDYEKVVMLHIQSGQIPKSTNIHHMASLIRALGEPIHDKPIKDICFASVLLQLFNIAQKFKMIVQPQLILLQKTLFNVESLARKMDPEMNLPSIVKPYLEQYLYEQKGISVNLYNIINKIPECLENYAQKIDNDNIYSNENSKYNDYAKKSTAFKFSANTLLVFLLGASFSYFVFYFS